jgi:pilus assembly protein CpaB
VDVLATFTTDEGPIARAVVENVEIIAAGTPYDAELAAQQRRPVPPSVVTLAVTPEQAERIALVATNGQILLALRNPADDDSVATPGVRLRGLLPQAAAAPPPPSTPRPAVRRVEPPPVQPVVLAAPPPVPPKPYMVEAYRAAKKTEEALQTPDGTTR